MGYQQTVPVVSDYYPNPRHIHKGSSNHMRGHWNGVWKARCVGFPVLSRACVEQSIHSIVFL